MFNPKKKNFSPFHNTFLPILKIGFLLITFLVFNTSYGQIYQSIRGTVIDKVYTVSKK